MIEVSRDSLGVITPKKLGRGVRPASQNPYPNYDQTNKEDMMKK